LYARKFPGKDVEDAVAVYDENQASLFKAKREELAREMQECDAGLDAVVNKKRKIETQD
jgi:hypothetical protein